MTDVDLNEEIDVRNDELNRILDEVSQIEFEVFELNKKRDRLVKQFSDVRVQIDLFQQLQEAIQGQTRFSVYC